MLVMDQKVTTQAVLGELDARGIKFLTLRMRSPALIQQINALKPGDHKTIIASVVKRVSSRPASLMWWWMWSRVSSSLIADMV
jgi:hypothetical protein